MNTKTSSPEDFWRRVDKTRGGDACWPWTGCLSNGYGRLSFQRSLTSAHRVAYTLTNGPIPDGLHVLHACDNPPCCNPRHLSVGTNGDNMADAASKGRGPWMSRRILTAEQADLIRASDESITALARRYGVGESTVRKIRHGVIYRTVGKTAPGSRHVA
jgi:hypothetical protein